MTYFEDGFLEISRRQHNKSKYRCQDEDIMFHCWIAGLLERRSRGKSRDGEQRREESDIRKAETIASKWKSFLM